MTQDEVLAFLIDKAMGLKMIMAYASNGKVTTPDDKLVELSEQIVVQATERRNIHDRDHAENYSPKCLFCVEAIKESNK